MWWDSEREGGVEGVWVGVTADISTLTGEEYAAGARGGWEQGVEEEGRLFVAHLVNDLEGVRLPSIEPECMPI